MKPDFTVKLLLWNQRENKRSMPWKAESDPYRIWLSEVILQQTRVEQGLKYYENFISTFPTIQDLARAPEQTVFKFWEGLGYYTRCRNLHFTAKFIVEHYQGKFPDTYPAIRELKGVGPYTAAAIASFAFNLPFAVVDGNVQRVLSRYFGINTPIDSGSGKKFYQELAQSLLDHDEPGTYNQAIMDFGATICKPQNPLCEKCVQNQECQAFAHGWVDILPVKEKALTRKNRWFTYYLVQLHDNIYIRQRNGKDIWSQLYEFILHETEDEMQLKSSTNVETIKNLLGTSTFSLRSISPLYKQQLTHQTVFGQFVSLDIEEPISDQDFELVRKSELKNYAFPKLINTYLNSELL